jgi:hypothetical protein
MQFSDEPIKVASAHGISPPACIRASPPEEPSDLQ